ncbi:uncharacterized protein LOC143249102 [Tachypleus tridentatus]|uniref:uncharacterized protein LOC143249102 n=1 Tax=Tachypleus tridentatus TaxID=6853 RepID=UPI003FD24A69
MMKRCTVLAVTLVSCLLLISCIHQTEGLKKLKKLLPLLLLGGRSKKIIPLPIPIPLPFEQTHIKSHPVPVPYPVHVPKYIPLYVKENSHGYEDWDTGSQSYGW